MKIGMIGSGRMAQAMGGYLVDHGYPVSGLWGRNQEAAHTAAGFLRTAHFEKLDDIVAQADILMLAVSDDALTAAAEALSNCGVPLKGKWIGHFSGSSSLDILEPLRQAESRVFSLHPLQTVPTPEQGRVNLGQATFVLEAEKAFQSDLTAWLMPCGNPVLWLSPGKKALYHLGACLASNYVMTLYRLAEEALVDSGIPEAAASVALLPLMESTLKSYRTLGASKGLTGPVSRGDSETVKKHLESLQTAEWAPRDPLVRALGLEALQIAQHSNRLSMEKARQMQETLKGGNES